jgi:hypothetical protein
MRTTRTIEYIIYMSRINQKWYVKNYSKMVCQELFKNGMSKINQILVNAAIGYDHNCVTVML